MWLILNWVTQPTSNLPWGYAKRTTRLGPFLSKEFSRAKHKANAKPKKVIAGHFISRLCTHKNRAFLSYYLESGFIYICCFLKLGFHFSNTCYFNTLSHIQSLLQFTRCLKSFEYKTPKYVLVWTAFPGIFRQKSF